MQRYDTAREALPADAGETGRADHVRKRGGLRKFTNRFHKVAIRFRVAGHGAAERRNHLERKQIVNPVQPGHVDSGEFQAQQSTAVLEHAKRFVEREIDSRRLGEMVMEELRKLDKVAYIRFASVYRSFQDVEDFREAIREVREK